jgi:4-alpha-glucanotransferase
MLYPRSSGILLHPTSLPGRYGIGDLGEWAYKFVDWLAEAGQTVWQILPLGPTSYGDSPYQTLSAFAGNTLLISFDKLAEQGWLTADDLKDTPEFPVYQVDFGWVINYHNEMLSRAYQHFEAKATEAQKAALEAWCAENADWLDDFALFIALKNHYGGKPWVEWPEGEALRHPDAITAAKQRHAHKIAEHRFCQWIFATQWAELKAYANESGVRLVGDIPIFVAHDSSDVWANRDLYYLDAKGNPTVIAGVPPDYFSKTGQRWGNPLYRWDVMAKDGYRWWIRRIQAVLSQVDIVRIDHFRGFEAYWEVPASEETAINGKWVPGPGLKFFKAVKEALGELPIIAEDLGLITKGVVELRDGLGLPGMKILQFAFGGLDGDNDFLPHMYTPNCVVYSGTHDNNTTVGWWESGEAHEGVRKHVTEYIGHEVREPNWDLMRLAMISVAHTCVVPLQDVFSFGMDTRMNMPGRPSGNWTWRFSSEWLQNPAQKRLAYLTKLYGRWPKREEEQPDENHDA